MTRWQRMLRHPVSFLHQFVLVALTCGVSTAAYPADVTWTGGAGRGPPGVSSQLVVNGGRVLNLNSGATFQGSGLFLSGGTLKCGREPDLRGQRELQ